jgi:hypothetical protein
MIRSYIEEESRTFPTSGRISFHTGFIIYNMQHPQTITIQQMWMEHISRIGFLQCQIAFFYVAQNFPGVIEEFKELWSYGRKTVFYTA